MAEPSKEDREVLEAALKRFKSSQDGSDYARDAYYDDIKFGRLGDQWPDEVRKLRMEEGRPCLTINKLPAFIRQVINDARQNKPGIQVRPVDNGADVDTAQVINGLIRAIEKSSHAAIAYDTAMDHAVSGGFGFFRIVIDYAHDNTFAMECRIERVPNALMVHWDTSTTEFDASDWNFAFVSEFMTEEEFKEQYPDAEPVSFESDNRDYTDYWIESESKVRLAEYWTRETEKKRLYLLSDGRTISDDVLPDMIREAFKALEQPLERGISDEDLIEGFAAAAGLEVVRSRIVDVPKVTRRVINGAEVLEEEDWPGSMIPIVPVWGEEVISDGRRHTRSLISDARDTQVSYNLMRSKSMEAVANAPKVTWVGPVGFMPNNQRHKWETMNTRSYSVLEYDQTAGKPERQPFAGVPTGILQEALNASDDMKAAMGMFDAALGARSNETSGRAILARQRESDVSNFHFVDNLSRAIEYAGRVLVEVIPHVYTQQETIRILGEDMKEKVVALRAAGLEMSDDEKLYDLTTGKYDVSVESGPSFNTQREETRETLIEVMRQIPDAAAVLGDVLMENLDFKGADRVARRLKLLLPPQVQQAEGIAGASQMPPTQPGFPGANAPPGGAAFPLDGGQVGPGQFNRQ